MRTTTFLVDLDETLISAHPGSLAKLLNYTNKVKERLPKFQIDYDYIATYGVECTFSNFGMYAAYPHPQAIEFLTRLADRGPVYIFTAAHPEYADTWANKFGFWDIIDGIYTTRDATPPVIETAKWILFDDTPAFAKIAVLPSGGRLVQLVPFKYIHLPSDLLGALDSI